MIAVAVGVFLTAAVTCNRNQKVEETTEIVRDTVVKTIVKETPIRYVDTVYVKSKPITITVPNNATLEPNDSTTVNTTKYTGTESLDNGTIGYEIYADSLHALNFTLTTKDTVITNTITNTITLPTKSRLFITGGIEGAASNPIIPQAGSVGLMYNRRQKWGAGIEVRQDFSGLLPTANATTVGIKVYIGL